MESLQLGPSSDQEAWQTALLGGDDSLLSHLVASERPGITFFQITFYINVVHSAGRKVANAKAAGIDGFEALPVNVERVLPILQSLRRRLGWRQRELDLGLLRLLRQWGALSVVIGAGASQGAGGPGWAELVRLVLDVALKKRDEIVRGKRLSPESEAAARAILATIAEKGANTDTETLKRGAQLCSDHFGQHLFTYLTGILYGRAPRPSATHRAIAELAAPPGLDAILTYNFDDLMGEALNERGIAHQIWAQTKRGVMGTPRARLSGLERGSEERRVLPVFHLHGFTPRGLSLITDTEFVFSTLQYSEIYARSTETIIDKARDEYLAQPLHLALYVGCSFSDEAMNGLLKKAFERYPGRFHFALLRWPTPRRGAGPSGTEMELQAARYLEIGVQPVWYDDVEDIPGIIRSLQ